MRIFDRLLLRCIRARLRHDTGNGFTGKLILCAAERIRQCGEEIDAQKAIEAVVAKVALKVAALDQFAKLEAGQIRE